MKPRLLLLALALVLSACSSSHPVAPKLAQDLQEVEQSVTNAAGVSCGVERQAAKTGVDPDVKLVKPTLVSTTVAKLAALPAPPTTTGVGRVAPVERTTYRVSATVTSYKSEADSDVHLVLNDGKGHTMIAEIPQPSCVGASSPFLKKITVARQTWDAAHPASLTFVALHQKVTLTGVGFFDRPHHQQGLAPNGIEVHPVLSITLGK